MSRFVKWFDHHHGCEGVEQDINVYAAENNLSIINVCPYYFWGAYAIFEKVEQGKGTHVVPKRDTYYIEEGKPPVLIETSENRRSKIAREIFEEIENNYADFLFDGYRNIVVLTEKDFAELKKKYTEGGE